MKRQAFYTQLRRDVSAYLEENNQMPRGFKMQELLDRAQAKAEAKFEQYKTLAGPSSQAPKADGDLTRKSARNGEPSKSGTFTTSGGFVVKKLE